MFKFNNKKKNNFIYLVDDNICNVSVAIASDWKTCYR